MRSVSRVVAATTSLLVAALGLAVTAPPAAAVAPTAFTVTTAADSGPGSLRQAMIDANATGNVDAANPDTIAFDPGITGVISIASALPTVTGALTITGPGQSQLSIDAAGFDRIVAAASGATLTVDSLALINGAPTGCIDVAAGATVNVVLDWISGCAGNAAAIVSSGTLTIDRSYVADSSNTGTDGALVTVLGGTTTITASSLFNGNTSHNGSALNLVGGFTLVKNSSIVGSGADGNGSAIYANGGDVQVVFSTISGNNARTPGGSAIFFPASSPSTVTARASIIASADTGAGQSNCGGGLLVDQGYNMVSDGSCGLTDGTSQVLADPKLWPFDQYGGPTKTMRLDPASAVLNVVPAADCFYAPAGGGPTVAIDTDQRGVPRPLNGQCDLGAVEDLTPIVITSTADAGPGTLREALTWLEIDGSTSAASPTAIDVASGVTGTITLASDLPTITRKAVLNGPNTGTFTIDGVSTYRPFTIGATGALSVYRVTVSNGTTIDSGGCFTNAGYLYLSSVTISNCHADVSGGGVYNATSAQATIEDSTLTGNTSGGTVAAGGGGAVASVGPLIVRTTNVTSNTTDDNGGAILGIGGVVLSDVTLTSNTASAGDGGAIASLNTLSMTRVTLTGNTATTGAGGAVSQTGSGTLDVSSSTISNNTADSTKDGGGLYLLSSGISTVADTTVSGNSARRGGGVFIGNGATATLTRTAVTSNTAAFQGGGVFALGNSTVDLVESAIRSNSAPSGGGIFGGNTGPMSIVRSTVAGNSATTGAGGGISSIRPLTIDASTLSGNTSNSGGAALNQTGGVASVTVTSSTIANNTAPSGGAAIVVTRPTSIARSTIADNTGASVADVGGVISSGSLTIASTVVSHQSALTGLDCALTGSLTDSGYNLAADASCAFFGATSRNSLDAHLGVLQDNAGPTFTMLPLNGSPLLNAIPLDNAACTDFAKDQRGLTRPEGAGCEIGAVETGNSVITANNVGITFGQTPNYTFSVTPAQSGANYVAPTCSAASYSPGSAVGTYAITCSGASADGWTFQYGPPGTLTVDKAGQANPSLTSTTGEATRVLNLTATGGGGTGAYVFSLSDSGTAVCAVSGTSVTAANAGTCQIGVRRLGDSNYLDSAVATGTVTFTAVAPSVARAVVASPRNGAAVVSWVAPASTGGASISRYVVTASPKVGSVYKTCSASSVQRSCTVSGLRNGTAYTFTVKTTNAGLKFSTSAKSLPVVAGAPSEPRALIVVFPAAKSAKVAWAGPSSLGSGVVLGYRVRWCAGNVCSAWTTLVATARTSTVTGRVKNASYRVEVQARNASGYGTIASKVFMQGK